RTVPGGPGSSHAGKSAASFSCGFSVPSAGTVFGAGGDGGWSRDRARQGCRARAYRDVFTACPVTSHHPLRPAQRDALIHHPENVSRGNTPAVGSASAGTPHAHLARTRAIRTAPAARPAPPLPCCC